MLSFSLSFSVSFPLNTFLPSFGFWKFESMFQYCEKSAEGRSVSLLPTYHGRSVLFLPNCVFIIIHLFWIDILSEETKQRSEPYICPSINNVNASHRGRIPPVRRGVDWPASSATSTSQAFFLKIYEHDPSARQTRLFFLVFCLWSSPWIAVRVSTA
jgi:hypothetical protein